jgi:hypothetical protein
VYVLFGVKYNVICKLTELFQKSGLARRGVGVAENAHEAPRVSFVVTCSRSCLITTQRGNVSGSQCSLII